MSLITERADNKALAAELQELLDVVAPASVADMLLQRAFSHGATDVHLDPVSGGIRVRFRVDGALRDVLPIAHDKSQVVMSRIKVLAGMDITERRTPQDGHISSRRLDDVRCDIRVGSSPTVHGERLVLRMMPNPEDFVALETLGFYEDQLAVVKQLLQVPYGLILVVGPVGSGKTTTMYSLLRELNQPESSVVTIEDPVERMVPGVNQIQTDPKAGLPFVTALRGVLRQDPNVVCIGEIRDAETAQIAVRAATTGVLVVSTLHANDTASAIDVLRQFDVPAMAIADALRGIVSQRLVRKICPTHREEYEPDDSLRELLQLTADQSVKICRGVKADKNFQSGYSGRTAVFETMTITPELRDAINSGDSAYKIMRTACELGMKKLEDSARRQVLDHVTSIEELRRVLSDLQLIPT